jgi:hypothetical protein
MEFAVDLAVCPEISTGAFEFPNSRIDRYRLVYVSVVIVIITLSNPLLPSAL